MSKREELLSEEEWESVQYGLELGEQRLRKDAILCEERSYCASSERMLRRAGVLQDIRAKLPLGKEIPLESDSKQRWYCAYCRRTHALGETCPNIPESDWTENRYVCQCGNPVSEAGEKCINCMPSRCEEELPSIDEMKGILAEKAPAPAEKTCKCGRWTWLPHPPTWQSNDGRCTSEVMCTQNRCYTYCKPGGRTEQLVPAEECVPREKVEELVDQYAGVEWRLEPKYMVEDLNALLRGDTDETG